MSNPRFKPSVRRDIILRSAVEIARRPGGWAQLTRRAIARGADCSDAMVNLHLGNMPSVRKAVMKYAIQHEIVEIIAQSIAAYDGYAVVSADLRQRSIASLLG